MSWNFSSRTRTCSCIAPLGSSGSGSAVSSTCSGTSATSLRCRTSIDAEFDFAIPEGGWSQATAEAQILVAEEVASQVLDVLDGRSARYAVNAPLLTPETAQAIAPSMPRKIASAASSQPR